MEPRNRIWLCSTSIVAPRRRVSLAVKLEKMMLRIEVFPADPFPISNTFLREDMAQNEFIVARRRNNESTRTDDAQPDFKTTRVTIQAVAVE